MSSEEPNPRVVETNSTVNPGGTNKNRRPRRKKPTKPEKVPSIETKTSNEPLKSAEQSTSKQPAEQPGPARRNKNLHFNKSRIQGRLTVEPAPEEAKTCNNNSKKTRSKKRPSATDQNDLSSVLIHKLRTSEYECMICYDVVKPAHHTWHCENCWAIFHLNCIQRWASKSLKDTSSSNIPVTSWRCPGCQHERTAVPNDYLCFCGKQRNPELNKFATPHSCSQLCKKTRQCPHPCVLPCHPGRCPPCTAMGPLRTCYCSRNKKLSRCAETDYTTYGYPCEDECRQLQGCGKHKCQDKCHPGLCRPCTVEEEQLCYCGEQSRVTRCSSGEPVKLDGHQGHYTCEGKCNKFYKCGKHACQNQCHPCTASSSRCLYDPDIVKTCPCGSTLVTNLLDGSDRVLCTDPVPTCNSTCNKVLACGHRCKKKCHTGDCSRCDETVQVSCRCSSTIFKRVCADVCEASGGEKPLCTNICKAKRNCGRHQCGTTCCPAKNESKSKPDALTELSNHDCDLDCGRTLSCGLHKCDKKCHKGSCAPCLEAEFDTVTCNCGRTRLEPPVRCGTKLPPCPYPCTRPAPCGHFRFLQHNCHPDKEPCPPCSTLIARRCLCDKVELKNVPCYRENPQCGQLCMKDLPCGRHSCSKSCHAGPCLSEGESCQRICNNTRSCGHPCLKKCHADLQCPETDPCSVTVRASCRCGQHAMEIPCNATSTSSGSNQKLDCNDFCAKVERNRRIAEAFEITPDRKANEAELSSDELGYYDESLREFYMENRGWCKKIELMLCGFVSDESTALHYCKPMRSEYRRFIHRYCIHFNVSTEAVDIEPHRSVIIRKSKSLGKCRIPSILLSKAALNPELYERTQTSFLQQNNLEPAVKKYPKTAINALYLSDVKFGMTKEDLDESLAPLLDNTKFCSRWINDVDVILTLDETVAVQEREPLLWELKKLIKSQLPQNNIAMQVDCCWVNREGHVSWTEKRKTDRDVLAKPTPAVTNQFEALADADEESEWIKVTPSTSEEKYVDNEDPESNEVCIDKTDELVPRESDPVLSEIE